MAIPVSVCIAVCSETSLLGTPLEQLKYPYCEVSLFLSGIYLSCGCLFEKVVS